MYANKWLMLKLLLLHSNSGNHITVSKQMRKSKWNDLYWIEILEIISLWKKMSSGLFHDVFRKMFTNRVYLIYKSRQDFSLNKLQCLIWHKTKPTYEVLCREEENLVFCFGALFNSTLNFTQSGWLIPFSPDLHFRLAKRVSGQTHSLRLETATRTDVSLVAPA